LVSKVFGKSIVIKKFGKQIPVLVIRRNYGLKKRVETMFDRTTTTSVTNKKDDGIEQKKSQQLGKIDENPEETTENSLTPAIRFHLAKVYGLVMATVGVTSLGVLVGGALSVSMTTTLIAFLASLAGVIAIAFTDPRKSVLRQNLLMGVGFLSGVGITPLVLGSTLGAVFASLFLTTGVFAAFTLAALKAKKQSWLTIGGPLMSGLALVFLASVGSLIFPLVGITNPAFLSALYNINIYGGVVLFSLFIAYDTQRMIETFRQNPDDSSPDHVSPALNMFLNLISLFIRFLEIFRR